MKLHAKKVKKGPDDSLAEKLFFHELGESVAPVWHRGKPGEAEHHLVEAGILRARSGTGKFLRGAWGNCLRFPGETEDLPRKLEPGGFAFASEVERADEPRIRQDVAELARHGSR